MNLNLLTSNIKAASKQIPCDFVIKNINIIDVFQSETFISDVAIHQGIIVGIGNYSGIKELDGTDKYICPGLIDAHCHIESSLVTPVEFSKVALLHGVTTVIADPHEIANVLGVNGIQLMLDLSENIPFDMYYMLPSCVPATSFETSGATLDANDLKPFLNHQRVLGLAEVMNYPAVLNGDSDMLQKIINTSNQQLVIDGHGAGFDIDMLNAYITAGITTDHECITSELALERIRRGMYVLMREGTVAKNLLELIKIASIKNSRRICLCTDDKHIDDLLDEGSIDHSIRLAIKAGLNPELAIQMGTLNTYECYKINNKGAIAPGYIADFIILDDLDSFKINSVYKDGKLVVKDNELVTEITSKDKLIQKNTINIPIITKDMLNINIENKEYLNVIEIIPNLLETNYLKYKITDNNQSFIPDIEKDLLKIAVIERHKNTNNIGLGIIKGLTLKNGAIATTIAHDSHNIIAAGTNDEDIIYACNVLKEMGGGIVVVNQQQVLASITLEIAGLITNRDANTVIKDLNKLHHAVNIIAPDLTYNPFLTLSFLALPVIPEIRITDKGLFNVNEFTFIEASQ